MTLQELVNNLSNKLSATSGDTKVHIRVQGKQDIVYEVIVEDSGEGQVVIVLR